MKTLAALLLLVISIFGQQRDAHGVSARRAGYYAETWDNYLIWELIVPTNKDIAGEWIVWAWPESAMPPGDPLPILNLNGPVAPGGLLQIGQRATPIQPHEPYVLTPYPAVLPYWTTAIVIPFEPTAGGTAIGLDMLWWSARLDIAVMPLPPASGEIWEWYALGFVWTADDGWHWCSNAGEL